MSKGQRKKKKAEQAKRIAANYQKQQNLKANDGWYEKKSVALENNYSKIVETLINNSKYIIKSKKGKVIAKVPGSSIRLANGNKIETIKLFIQAQERDIKAVYDKNNDFMLRENNLAKSFDEGLEQLCNYLNKQHYRYGCGFSNW